MHCSRRLIVQTQASPPETLVVKGGTTWARNGRWILPENSRLPRNIQGSFTCRKSTTWDRRLYFPSDGRRAEDFFSPGLNPRTWVPKASTLPLDHRSRLQGTLSNRHVQVSSAECRAKWRHNNLDKSSENVDQFKYFGGWYQQIKTAWIKKRTHDQTRPINACYH